jgi:adenylate cyclase class IV
VRLILLHSRLRFKHECDGWERTGKWRGKLRNLEAKFALGDLDRAHAAASALGYRTHASFTQRDTFFACAHGKLKLREQSPEAWLIHYRRDRESGLMLSHYEIVQVADPARLREMLTLALGVTAEVRKLRTLLVRRNVRLHLDRVDTLGGFGEIEAVLADAVEAATDGGVGAARAAVAELLGALGVRPDELIEASYFELMARG